MIGGLFFRKDVELTVNTTTRPNGSLSEQVPICEDTIEHLKMIQATVARLAGNSFLVKGWSITLSAALFALAAKDANPLFALIALLPAVSFWGLDAYYLRHERLFRRLYDHVRLAAHDHAKMEDSFSLSTSRCTAEVPSWFRTLWSPAILWLHGAVIVTTILVVVVLSAVQVFNWLR